jgi:hypothetical protein
VTSSTDCSRVARPAASTATTFQVFVESVLVSTVWVTPFMVVSVSARGATRLAIASPLENR